MIWGFQVGTILQMQTYFLPKIMHENFAVILQLLKFFCGKFSFAVFVPCSKKGKENQKIVLQKMFEILNARRVARL